MKKSFCIICFCFLLLFSCKNQNTITTSLEREQLFILNYGSFEDELDLFNLSSGGIVNTYLKMRDGFFFVVNGRGKKLMHLTSYGDLLAVYYNPDTNLVPSFINQENSLARKITTQQAIPHPFQTLGKIAVDSNKNIYVVDQLPEDRQEQDSREMLLLREVVLRFSSDGTYMDYVGQGGLGGRAFPFIRDIFTTKANELVVVSVTNKGLLVNWFSENDMLKYSIPLNTESLPNPHKGTKEVYITLDSVVPDYDAEKLYLKIDYHSRKIDPNSNVQSGITYLESYLYPFDIQTAEYGKPILIPSHETVVKDNFSETVYTNPYEFLGMSDTGWFFFVSPDDTGYMVQIIKSDNSRIIKKHLQISRDEMLYNSLSLSQEGIISALLANNFEASVVWWRTDTLIGAVIQ
ncbi:MAG: LIC_12708 family protein [Treponemataceae bacterium]